MDQKVLVIDNSAVIETGTIRYVGIKAGMPFNRIERYPTTWVSWAHGWQIAAIFGPKLQPDLPHQRLELRITARSSDASASFS